MAYKTEELAAQAIQIIKEHNLFIIEDVVSLMPCSVATFYNHKLEELEDIKRAIEEEKVNTKASLRKKWKDSDAPVLQLALYKLAGTKGEVSRLSNGKIEVSGVDGKDLFQKSEMDKHFETLSEEDKRKIVGL